MQAAKNNPSCAGWWAKNQSCVSIPCPHVSQCSASVQTHKVIAQSKGLGYWYHPTNHSNHNTKCVSTAHSEDFLHFMKNEEYSEFKHVVNSNCTT